MNLAPYPSQGATSHNNSNVFESESSEISFNLSSSSNGSTKVTTSPTSPPVLLLPAELFAKASTAPLHSRLPTTGRKHSIAYFETGSDGGGSSEQELRMGLSAEGRRLRRKMDTPTEFEVAEVFL